MPYESLEQRLKEVNKILNDLGHRQRICCVCVCGGGGGGWVGVFFFFFCFFLCVFFLSRSSTSRDILY